MSAVDALAAPREPLAERLLDAFPSGSYALTALLRLMDIVESRAVETAAVECRLQPRLLMNPDFVDAHAATAEKLLALVMHELHHVLLGHTTLFPRVTPLQNFVFDAVINGLVCRMFPEAEYTAFFTDYYSAEAYPACLLRPPPGWPQAARVAPAIAALEAPRRERVAEVHAALYSWTGATYQEVFEALPRLLDAQAIAGVPLLGGHNAGGVADGALEQQAPVLFDVVRDIVAQWPQPPDPIRGQSLADVLAASRVAPQRRRSRRSLLRGLIRRIAGAGGAGAVRRPGSVAGAVATPIPGLDRRAAVLRALGQPPLLYAGQAARRARVREGERVHVYLDVSGSMDGIKGPLYGAVLDCAALVQAPVHLFSTRVAELSLAELRRGLCRSTGGTDIACVAEHMAAHRVRRAVIVTDGYVGAPRGAHRATLDGVRLGVALFGDNVNAGDLADVADHTVHLPTGDPS